MVQTGSTSSRFDLRHAVFVVVLLALSACATRGGPVPYNVSNFTAPDAPVVPNAGDYHVGPADVVTVAVFNVPEFSGDFSVDDLGRIKMPLIGEVSVAGMTPDEISADLGRRLSATYLRSPSVQVQMKSAASKHITVDGSVAAPGIYTIAGKMSLVQAIAQAKGTVEGANPRRTVIFRTINGQRMAAAFDLTDIRRGIMPNPDVYPDDVVVVDGTKNAKLFQSALQTIPIIGLFTRF